MARVLQTYVLAGLDGSDQADAIQQLAVGAGPTEQTLTLETDCSAVMLSARTQNVYVTFNDTAAASTNGLEIVAAAQPVFIPLGYNAHSAHKLRAQGAAANALLNVIQLA